MNVESLPYDSWPSSCANLSYVNRVSLNERTRIMATVIGKGLPQPTPPDMKVMTPTVSSVSMTHSWRYVWSASMFRKRNLLCDIILYYFDYLRLTTTLPVAFILTRLTTAACRRMSITNKSSWGISMTLCMFSSLTRAIIISKCEVKTAYSECSSNP